MKKATIQMLLQVASSHNILILSTRCATSCVFCSHHQNPPDVEAFYVDDIREEDADTLIEFLDSNQDIVIGESATRICEGEPFLHKDIMNILKKIRQKHGKTKIKITTSAVPLTEAMIAELKTLGNTELNVSLNSSTVEGRNIIYRGRALEEAIEAIKLLNKYEIHYNGSIVAMPHLVGWKDIEATALFLAEQNAVTIRIFMPGYTKYTKGQIPSHNIIRELNEFGRKITKCTNIPIIIEPPIIKNLDAVIEGVIKDSPGFEAGLRSGDVIMAVNGDKVLSRVDAFNKVYGANNPAITYYRDGVEHTEIIRKSKKASSGLVVNYDIHPRTISDIKRLINKHKGKKCTVLTSELAYEIIRSVIGSEYQVEIQKVINKAFGGNIMCAGLLTVQDIVDKLGNLTEKPDVVILPSVMFDENGRDLFGESYLDIYTDECIKIEIV